MSFHQELIRQIIHTPALKYSGVRKIVQNVHVETKALPVLTFEQLGYGKNKLAQLKRNYINEEEFQRVRSILEKRKSHEFTSVALALRGAKKDSRSQGWCMLDLIVSRTRDFESVDINYRSTEVTLKFGGDLAFLPWVFEQLGLDPDVIRFHFANLYLSGVFLPTLSSFWDPVELLEYLWEHDRKLFSGGTRFFLRSSYKRDQVFPYSPEQQQHKFLWNRCSGTDIRRIRTYLEKKHRTFGKPLPKTHHKPGEYVPRGKRQGESDED